MEATLNVVYVERNEHEVVADDEVDETDNGNKSGWVTLAPAKPEVDYRNDGAA